MFSNNSRTITENAADYLAKIVESATRLKYNVAFLHDILLHEKNRLKTIYSSLAIEGNALTLDQVTAVIEGKRVAGKQAEIKEVKNAYEAYDRVMTLNPYSLKDFLLAHKLMTEGLIDETGKFRTGDVGVFDGDIAVHIGARPEFVPELMKDLFDWAKESDLHPVLKSAIVHYEIETIHPFADGNGRMGRLWQTLILAKWNEVFKWIPMESVLYKNRPQYYKAIQDARKANDSGVFIEFTLSAVLESLSDQEKHQDEHQDEHQDKLSELQIKILRSLEGDTLSKKEIFEALGISVDSRASKRHLDPLLDSGLVEMTLPDRPNSKLQKYRLTAKGSASLKTL